MKHLQNKIAPVITILLICKVATSQYKGGANDGFAFGTYNRQNITDVAVFKGGSDDGFAIAVYNRQIITDAIAFKGGNDDGFAVFIVNKQNTTDPTAFKGGNDDGFTSGAFNKQNITDATAFKGGNDDGFTSAVFNRQNITDALAFKGGGNDGFTFSVYLKNKALPVKLISFSGIWNNNTALLNWQTASEINTEKFIIERSFTGNDFTAIGTVAATGSSNNLKAYQYKDENVAAINTLQKQFFYHLKTVDADGKFYYSAIVLLTKNQNSSFSVSLYPNPASSFVNIAVEGIRNSHNLSLTVTDAAGKIITQQKNVSNPGRLNTYQLSPGQYFISIYDNNQLIKTIPVIIQH